MTDLKKIRNFCIIAHIDHGKSTLADRMLQLTSTVEQRDMCDQILDDMDLERERGITIKTHPVTMNYTAEDGQTYKLNLLDTPGHVDFSYEVSRGLAACEGAILVVDASQGVEAQTVSNLFMAVEQDLTIIPVLNKIDMVNADVASTITQLEDLLAIERENCLQISAKKGEGIEAVLEAVVKRISPPTEIDKTTQALVFDSTYDPYRGAAIYVRLFAGSLKKGDTIKVMSSDETYEVREVGTFTPHPNPTEILKSGDVGYLMANIKEIGDVKIGDTITKPKNPAKKPLLGFQEMRPTVFTGLYPVDAADYEKLSASLDKLHLNDSAFSFQKEFSVALGFGFRCGFLGLLHLEIIQERLQREYDLDIITTYPGVIYNVHLASGKTIELENPVCMPPTTDIDRIEEPLIEASIICLNEDIGGLMQLIMDRRGEITHTDSLDGKRVMLTADIPLNEILIDFYDKLKSISHGYASMDYEPKGYRPADLVKMDILVNKNPVDAFASVVHRDKAVGQGRKICKTLKDIIPRKAFSVPIQAAIGRDIIARETIKAYRKDVTAKCYGGDITRKRKLLERQKEGKKKMKQVGSVNIPQEAFVAILKSK